MLPPPTSSPPAQSLQVVQMPASPTVNSGAQTRLAHQPRRPEPLGFPQTSTAKTGTVLGKLRRWPSHPRRSLKGGSPQARSGGAGIAVYGAKARRSHCLHGCRAPVTSSCLYKQHHPPQSQPPTFSKRLSDSAGQDLVGSPRLWALLPPPPSP